MVNLELWKKAKKERNLTIEQIATRANLPKGSVQNIFAGYVDNPRIDTVQRIEYALGLSVSSDERAEGVKDTVTVEISALEDEFLALFRELGLRRGQDSQNAILTIINTMLH